MISKVLVILVLGPLLFYNVTESCVRGKATPKSTTPPAITTPRATINDSVRSLPCTENETKEAGCLNGGTCFVLVLEYTRRETCLCTPKYMGTRCEELNIDVLIPSVDPVATAGIVSTSLAVVIAVFIGVVIFCFRKKKRRRRREAAKFIPGNENEKLAENHMAEKDEETEMLEEEPRPRSRPNSQHLPSDRHSLLYLNGSLNSNGASMSAPNGNPSPDIGFVMGNDSGELDQYDGLKYIDEVDKTNNQDTMVDKGFKS